MALAHRVNLNFSPLLSAYMCKCTISSNKFLSTNQDDSVKQNGINLNTHNDGLGKKDNTAKKFNDILKFRQDQASRTILVHLPNIDNIRNCLKVCEPYGKVKNLFHYVLQHNNYLLMEFTKVDALDMMDKSSSFNSYYDYVPLKTPNFSLHVNDYSKKCNPNIKRTCPIVFFSYKPYKTMPTMFNSIMHSSSNLSKQMIMLQNSLQISDVETRLKFYTARQIELCLSRVLPTAIVVPFGSSVNGFGQGLCDLDLLCIVENGTQDDSKKDMLKFASKTFQFHVKSGQQNFLKMMSLLIRCFIPGFTDVREILMASVPILKFQCEYNKLCCDLSTGSRTALYMTELLYIYGELDARVKPLVCTIRTWARVLSITNEQPGSWISNFSLTLLVIFFLQQRQIVPAADSLTNYLSNNAYCELQSSNSHYTTGSSIDASSKDLSALLQDFFEYYASFDFAAFGICIVKGRIIRKSVPDAMHITNPFESVKNVAKNVDAIQRIRFQTICAHACKSFSNVTNLTTILKLPTTNVSHLKNVTGTKSQSFSVKEV